ncbi:MAG: pepsin-like aspartic protease [Marinicella sp.]
MKNKQIKLPINLANGIGAYTTQLYIGSQKIEVNVLLDTGSSTLAIDLNKYQPDQDSFLETTVYAQDVVYGSGGWAGPVIRTQIELNHDEAFKLNAAPMAITAESQQQNFQQADGIWGLAYHHLNKAYDVTSFLESQTPALAATYPWPFEIGNNSSAMADFKKKLRTFPEQDITPLFTDFEENQVTANQFTISTRRSIVYQPLAQMTRAEVAAEELNQGQFIIGQSSPYDSTQPIQSIQVLHDAYYNTHLQSIRVAGFESVEAPPLDEKHVNSFFSNAIIDSGCSYVILQKSLYAYLISCLKAINPSFITFIDAFKQSLTNGQKYKNPQLSSVQWPTVYLCFTGSEGEPVELSITANNYWQSDAEGPGNWHFMFMDQLPQWPEQTICGLPLLNDYDCVFDRASGDQGVIHWHEQK